MRLSEEGAEACIFCKIARHEVESHIVLEEDDSIAFLDKRPVFPGHTLLVTKAHYETLADLPTDIIGPLFSTAQLLATAVVEATRSDGSFVAINNRVSQSVPHLHVHVVPRRRGDGLRGFFWPRQPYKTEESALETQRAIRSAVERLRASKKLA